MTTTDGASGVSKQVKVLLVIIAVLVGVIFGMMAGALAVIAGPAWLRRWQSGAPPS